MLGGPYYGHVTLNNVRMLLLAIKGLHVQPDIDLDQNSHIVRMSDLFDTQSKSGGGNVLEKENQVP